MLQEQEVALVLGICSCGSRNILTCRGLAVAVYSATPI